MQDIRKVDYAEIQAFIESIGERAFRAKQIYEWLWQKGASEFTQMTNLSRTVRDKLAQSFYIASVTNHKIQESQDGTVKVLFRLPDDHYVEGVLIPVEGRVTACISSQVGCMFNCTFCATGKLSFKRNLEAAEMFDQVFLLNEQAKQMFGRHLSNIVYMGMGEPLMNTDHVIQSINMLTSDKGMGFSIKRITVSTVGIPENIKKLADESPGVYLALSLHSVDDQKRSSIIPVNKQYPLATLKEALQYFYKQTGTRITYEYLLLNRFNDQPEDVKQLLAFGKVVPCKVNLIEYNDSSDASYSKSYRMNKVYEALDQANIIVNIRRSRGEDIDAACGQLALRSW